jgi:catechol 2,3-dioxygenase-like lactoylglutathione lyase family enzyme
MRLQHVSIAIPVGGEAAARDFYGRLLGLAEKGVPPHLDPSGLIWFRLGEPDLELHLMLVDEPAPERPHLCIELPSLEDLRERLETAGISTSDATEIVGRPRFFCRDPFGNLLEFTRITEGGLAVPDDVLVSDATAPSGGGAPIARARPWPRARGRWSRRPR